MSDTAQWWTCANIVVINVQQYEAETGGSDNARGECSRGVLSSNLPDTSVFYDGLAASDVISGREINQRPLVATRVNRGGTGYND